MDPHAVPLGTSLYHSLVEETFLSALLQSRMLQRTEQEDRNHASNNIMCTVPT